MRLSCTASVLTVLMKALFTRPSDFPCRTAVLGSSLSSQVSHLPLSSVSLSDPSPSAAPSFVNTRSVKVADSGSGGISALDAPILSKQLRKAMTSAA
eukprot:scaffold7359_cov255-Pinguiococcus_pyrenoidosus.AAC.23